MGAILLAFLSLLGGQGRSNPVYQHSQCSYSFEYPWDWRIVQNPEDVSEECATTLRPVDFENRMARSGVDLFTLTVAISETSFLAVAADHGFDFDGTWVVRGRMGSADKAEVVNTNGWLILRGVSSVGCYHKAGGYAGLCDEYRVVAKYRDDPRIVAIVGATQTEPVLDLLVKTFKFADR